MSIITKSVSMRKYLGCSLAILLVTCNEVMLACGGQDKKGVSKKRHKEWGREDSSSTSCSNADRRETTCHETYLKLQPTQRRTTTGPTLKLNSDCEL